MSDKMQRLAPRRDWRQMKDKSVYGVLEDEPQQVAHPAEDCHTDAFIYLIGLEGPRRGFADRSHDSFDGHGNPYQWNH